MSELQTDNARIHFQVEGSGPAILFIQGVGVCGQGWKPQTDFFRGNFTTIVYDNRGLGKSTYDGGAMTLDELVEDARRLLDHLQIQHAHIVGHSLGGVVARLFAQKYPGRVLSLSLLCTFAFGAQAMKPNFKIIWLGMLSRLGTRRSRRRAFLRLLFSRKFLAGVKDQDQLAKDVGRIVGRDLGVTSKIADVQLKVLASEKSAEKIQASFPTLIISAEEDPIALPAYGEELAANISLSKYIVLNSASHGVVIEDPIRINNLLSQNF